MKNNKVIIVGGGASGILAAIHAAREGACVTLIEQKERVGKKILSTGNGRCNLTNETMSAHYFRGGETEFVETVLEQFDYHQTIEFFERLGLYLKNKGGYIYPYSEQASSVLDILSMELKYRKVAVHTNTVVHKIEKNKFFRVESSAGIFEGDAVILATGGKAMPVLGSDGSGYILAQTLGHSISQVVPALVALHAKGTFFQKLSGIRTHANVKLFVDERFVSEDTGELQLTNYGISGIPVFQISRYAAKAFAENKKVTAEIDFVPALTEEQLLESIVKWISYNPYKTAEQFCAGIWNKKLITILLRCAGIKESTLVSELNEDELLRLVKKCKHFHTDIHGTNSFEQAQVCAGGVMTKEINPHTMESKLLPGLYFAGEVIDVDGVCGGYNLQWAWSTGYIAGINAAKGN